MICQHLLNLSLPAVAPSTKIFKDECTLCFDLCSDGQGLDVCLSCFNGGCTRNDCHGTLHSTKNRDHIGCVRIKQSLKSTRGDEPPPQKITKLAIPSAKDTYTTEWSAVCYACPNTPVFTAETVRESSAKLLAHIETILDANSSAKQSEIQAWELEAKPCEHVLTLTTTNHNSVTTKHKKCSETDCDQTENLWLCLTCGNLGCGRRQPDGTGGNGHAVIHNCATDHAVAVKLGTITPEGSADLYCYKCNDEVSDPNLQQHLHHFGINMATQEKTATSLAEMQLELNLKYDFSMTTEDGKELQAVFGPGLTGIKNLGNSCYLASVMQCIAALKPVQARYGGSWGAEHILSCANRPESCLNCQLTKFVAGLQSGVYSVPDPASESGKGQQGVSPAMLKQLIGAGHPEFATMRQQDVAEFLTFFSETLEKLETPFGKNSLSDFTFATERRLQCNTCQYVSYTTENGQEMLLVPVPADADSLEQCLQAWSEPYEIDFSCSVCSGLQKAQVCSRISDFPRVLVVLAQRFVFENWALQKRLNALKANARGKSNFEFLGRYSIPTDRSTEKLMPAETKSGPKADPAALAQIQAMGFSELRSTKALLNTSNDVEAAMNWLFAHMEDPDIDDPIPEASAGLDSWSKHADKIASLVDMGFTELQAKKGLLENAFRVEPAIEWLFSNTELAIAEADVVLETAAERKENPNKSGDFDLFGVISHKGTSTACGHYVCHLKKQVGDAEEWILYNDNRVVKIEHFESDFGYLYFFNQL